MSADPSHVYFYILCDLSCYHLLSMKQIWAEEMASFYTKKMKLCNLRVRCDIERHGEKES